MCQSIDVQPRISKWRVASELKNVNVTSGITVRRFLDYIFQNYSSSIDMMFLRKGCLGSRPPLVKIFFCLSASCVVSLTVIWVYTASLSKSWEEVRPDRSWAESILMSKGTAKDTGYSVGRLSKAMHKMESSLKEPTDLVKQYNDMDPDMVTTRLLHSQLQSHGKSKDEVHETFAFKLKEENVKDNLLNSKANIAIYKDLSQAFNSSSVDERGQFQRKAIDEFCSQYPSLKSPPDEEHSKESLYKHLLYDDKKRIVFCYIPKVGCSNWKRMFVVLNNILPPTESSERPQEEILKLAKNLFDLSPEERKWRLETYFKVIMIRHPLERIVSIYRSKIVSPINLKERRAFPNREKLFMLKKFEKKSLQVVKKTGILLNITPAFESFVKFLIATRNIPANEHFTKQINLCFPCHVKYDFYANFKYLPDDAFRIMDKFQIPHHYYRNVDNHPGVSTADLLELHYKYLQSQERWHFIQNLQNKTGFKSIEKSLPKSSLQVQVLKMLLSVYNDELEFYYTLYPDERNSHLKLLPTI